MINNIILEKKKKKEDISKVNLFFDKVFLINLDKDKERLYKTNLILEKHKINYIKISAIDGKNPVIYRQWYFNLLKHKNYKIKSPGAFGYLLTYYYILLEALKQNYKSILILDDDIIFHKNFDNIINNCDYFNLNSSSFCFKEWKLIYFGACHQNHQSCTYFNNKYKKEDKIKTENPELFNIYDFIFKYGNGKIDGSHTIGINQSVIKELIYLIRNSTYPVDSGPFYLIYKKYPKQCFIFYPHLSIQRCEESSIQNYKNLNKFMDLTKKWGWDYNEFDI